MITRSLLEFIRKEQASGATKESITAMLGERGWKQADIASAFSFLLESAADRTAPTPPNSRTLVECCEILSLIWSVYRSRWKRFLGVGVLYVVVVALLEIAVYMWVLPVVPTFLRYVMNGDITSAFFFIAPYLMCGTLIYILLQLWYTATLYSVALKKGDSSLERAHTGLLHLPAVFGIKVVVALLLMIVFVPVLATALLTDNILVVVIFGPFFILAAGALWFLLSFSLPAYFHGVAWRSAPLRSIKLVLQNPSAIFALYASFGVLLALLFIVVRDTPIITIPIVLGFVTPMQTLLMIALYRRFSPSEPESSLEAPVSGEGEKKIEKKVRKAAKPLAA